MVIVIFILIVIVIIYQSIGGQWIKSRLKYFKKTTAGLFDHEYIESKIYYLYRFKCVPSVTYTHNIDMGKVFEFVQNNYSSRIVDIYQYCYLNREAGQQEFTRTLFVLDNEVLVEVKDCSARILFNGQGYEFADRLVKALADFKLPEKKEDFEINIITLSRSGLELKPLDIKPTLLDIGMYYNDDFKEVDELIRERLNRQSDKGIVLLHGLPGTGKTTYLRHLIGELKKKVLFVSPSVAGNLMNPEFIDLLIDNPNAILIIEDAENIMMDRKYNSDSSVSNLLNLSDGLLSDCLSVQIICTFNNALSLVDSALMRKGRMIAKYEFGKLRVEKAQQLSLHLGFDSVIDKPMTLAEIANQLEKAHQADRVEVIGFRTQGALMN
jgi:hypothetical protein